MLSFKPAFKLPSFTFIKRLFTSSISAIRVVSSAYLRLLIFLPEKVEVVTDFLFLGSKITADGDCSHEIRRHVFLDGKVMTILDSGGCSHEIRRPLLHGRKVMTNLDSVLKRRDKGLYNQGNGLPSGHVLL